jgi:(p)ppGpp synthase/HD superfamily hydrolase
MGVKKHLSQFGAKVQKKRISLEQITDIIGFRITPIYC